MAKANKGDLVFARGKHSDMEDIWDDSVLIESYERAASMAYDVVHEAMRTNGEFSAEDLERHGMDPNKPVRQREDSVTGNSSCTGDDSGVKKKGRKKRRSHRKKWQIDDKCLSKYSEDGQWYEATIIAIDRSHNRCTVRYGGYENEEDVNLGMLQKCPETSMDEEESAPSEQEEEEEREVQNFQTKPHTSRSPGESRAVPLLPPPVPPHLLRHHEVPQEDEAMAAMLMSWYTSGYHTGYYQAMRDVKGTKK